MGIVGTIVLVLAIFSQLQQQGIVAKTPITSSVLPQGKFYEVVKVVDGDTLSVAMDGGVEKVRLIGVNTPETVDPRREVQCFGKEASERMKELVSGKIVALEYDESQGTRDTYGRLLAYVYLEDRVMVNRKLIAEGYAYEYTYLHPYEYQKEFRDLQRLAKSSQRGLWAESTCGGKTFSQ